MIQALVNSFKIPDLRRRLLVTLALVAVYRIGVFIPTPGIDGQRLSQFFDQVAQTQGGTLFSIVNMFSGGAMEQLTIFALGIMPYISASIILQLLTAVIPALEKLAKQGEAGRRRITQYTRYGTVVLAVIQSFFISLWIENPDHFGGLLIVQHPGWSFRLLTVLTLTSGTAFIMWLGEQITEYGIGNGMSLLITVNIISRIPAALTQLYFLYSPLESAKRQLSGLTLVTLGAMMVGVIIAVIQLTEASRHIPVQYAKRIVGRRMFEGKSTYLPLRINQAGVIPIIFAQSIILFPATIAGLVPNPAVQTVANFLTRGQMVYMILYSALIIFFSFFYTAITLNPVDLAENMQKSGSFIPGIRPGRPTAEHLDYVISRITWPGAIALAVVAILPNFVSSSLKVPYLVASFLGGTGLLIIVGVMLDTMKQIESQLLMRHYEGFIKRGRLRGRYG